MRGCGWRWIRVVFDLPVGWIQYRGDMAGTSLSFLLHWSKCSRHHCSIAAVETARKFVEDLSLIVKSIRSLFET